MKLRVLSHANQPGEVHSAMAVSRSALLAAGTTIKLAFDGFEFIPRESPQIIRAATTQNDAFYVCGQNGYLASSKDQGASFQKIDVNTIKSLNTLAFDSRERLWLGGEKGHLSSTSTKGTIRHKATGDVVRVRAFLEGAIAATSKGEVLFADKNVKSLYEHSCGLKDIVVSDAGLIYLVDEKGRFWWANQKNFEFKEVASVMRARFELLEDTSLGIVAAATEGVFVEEDPNQFRAFPLPHPYTQLEPKSIAVMGDGFIMGTYNGVILAFGDIGTLIKRGEKDVAQIPPLEWSEELVKEPMRRVHKHTTKVEKVGGVFVSPWLRSVLAPKREGLHQKISPLVPKQEAWRELRKIVWDDSLHNRLTGQPDLFDELASSYSEDRRCASLFFEQDCPAFSSEDEIVIIETLSYLHRQSTASDYFADILIAEHGVEEACLRLLKCQRCDLDKMSPFVRFRELFANCEPDEYERLFVSVSLGLREEFDLATTNQNVERQQSLVAIWSFLFPLTRVSDNAEELVSKNLLSWLGANFNPPTCVSSGDVNMLRSFLTIYPDLFEFHKVVGGIESHLFMASMVERAALFNEEYDEILELLIPDKNETPLLDSGMRYMLLAHFDDPRVRRFLVERCEAGDMTAYLSLEVAKLFSPRSFKTSSKPIGTLEEILPPVNRYKQKTISGRSYNLNRELPTPPRAVKRPKDAPAFRLVFRSFERARLVARNLSEGWEGRALSTLSDKDLFEYREHILRHRLEIETGEFLELRGRAFEILGDLLLATPGELESGALISCFGESKLCYFLQELEREKTNSQFAWYEDYFEYARYIGDVRVGKFMLRALGRKYRRTHALDWIARHKRHALYVANKNLKAPNEKTRALAQEMKRLALSAKTYPLIALPDLGLKEHQQIEKGVGVAQLQYEGKHVILYLDDEESLRLCVEGEGPLTIGALSDEIETFSSKIQRTFDLHKQRLEDVMTYLLKGGEELSRASFARLYQHPFIRHYFDKYLWDDGERFHLTERMPQARMKLAHPIEMPLREVRSWLSQFGENELLSAQLGRRLHQRDAEERFLFAGESEALLCDSGFYIVCQESKFFAKACYSDQVSVSLASGAVTIGKVSERVYSECVNDIREANSTKR